MFTVRSREFRRTFRAAVDAEFAGCTLMAERFKSMEVSSMSSTLLVPLDGSPAAAAALPAASHSGYRLGR
jgi:hypothetical protein